MNIDEIYVFLKDNYPMYEWKIVPTTWSTEKMITWIPEKRFLVQIMLIYYKMENNKKQFISVGLDDKRNKICEIYPCDDLDELLKRMKFVITKYDPNIFEDSQMSIFDI